MLAAVIAKGGEQIEEELEGQCKSKMFLRTGGYSLPCDHVIHLNVSHEAVVETLLQALVLATRLHAKRIAIPFLGEVSAVKTNVVEKESLLIRF